jgi:hypothetical protein
VCYTSTEMSGATFCFLIQHLWNKWLWFDAQYGFRDFYFHHHVQKTTQAHSASYLMDTGIKMARAGNLSFASVQCEAEYAWKPISTLSLPYTLLRGRWGWWCIVHVTSIEEYLCTLTFCGLGLERFYSFPSFPRRNLCNF